jgi:truncated hemoglobin YjbI
MRCSLQSLADWNLIEECGGEAALKTLLRDFYDRIFDDVIIGFLFANSDKEALIESQFDYVTSVLGDRSGSYDGPTIRAAHQNLPILGGQFDRRHMLLKVVLLEYGVPEHVMDAWLELDQSLRDFVVNMGAAKRDELGVNES